MNRRRVKMVILALIALLVVIQFVQPARRNPPTDRVRTLQAHVAVPPQVQSVLQRGCYNCHSNQTAWPWYSHVAPVSWLVVDDVHDGRRHINFDDWDVPGTVGNAHMMCQDLRDGDMPLWYYRLIHADARLSADDKNAVCAWAGSVSVPPSPPPGGTFQ